MICPKCSTKMRKEEGGYSRANVSCGFGAKLPDNFSCPSCGKYIEIYSGEPLMITTRYPRTRKSLGEPGWLQEFVKEHFDEINTMRNNHIPWSRICIKLSKKYASCDTILGASIGNIFRRIIKERHYA